MNKNPATLQILFLASLIILFTLTACATATELSAPAPSNTATQPPPMASPTSPPAVTPTTPLIESPLPPIPPLPPAHILIQTPGFLSAITSPVTIIGFSQPVFEQTLVVQVLGEDGNILFQEPVFIEAELGVAGPFEIEANFAVDYDQPGRIVVFSESARDGGIEQLSSIEVTLLAGGTADIQPFRQRDYLFITSPQFEDVVRGGVVQVSGTSGPQFENTILITLCGENIEGEYDPICGAMGARLAHLPVMIEAPDIGFGGPFSVEIPYAIDFPQSVRIVVYVTSMRDGGITELTSRIVQFEP